MKSGRQKIVPNGRGMKGRDVLFILYLIFWVFVTTGEGMAYEEAKYTVIMKEGNYELRLYESHIVAETVVDGDFDKAGNEGFRRLFKYISGEN